MKISYQFNLDGISSDKLTGFFVGWPNPPSNEYLHDVLRQSAYICLALHDTKVVGFAHAISDGIMSAYIPLLEVLPEYQKKGIGRDIIKQLLQQMDHLYMIDICCDDEIVPFYTKLGFHRVNGMIKRTYKALQKDKT